MLKGKKYKSWWWGERYVEYIDGYLVYDNGKTVKDGYEGYESQEWFEVTNDIS